MPQLPFIDYQPSGGLTSYYVNKYTLTNTDITNKYVVLSGAPTTANKTVLDVIDGDSQDYGVDYIVTGNILSWAGLGLDSVLAAGDKLQIQFN